LQRYSARRAAAQNRVSLPSRPLVPLEIPPGKHGLRPSSPWKTPARFLRRSVPVGAPARPRRPASKAAQTLFTVSAEIPNQYARFESAERLLLFSHPSGISFSPLLCTWVTRLPRPRIRPVFPRIGPSPPAAISCAHTSSRLCSPRVTTKRPQRRPNWSPGSHHGIRKPIPFQGSSNTPRNALRRRRNRERRLERSPHAPCEPP
jgi:hypothetical protein